MTPLIDSHAHVSTPKFDADRAAVLARAREAGLVAIVDVGCDLASSRASLALAEAEGLVWAAAGVHPHEARHWEPGSAAVLRELLARPRCVALGEIGLDFHYDFSPREAQRDAFRAQLRLALELDKPVVLHVREAYPEALATLDELRGPRLRGVAHCFTGNAEEAAGFVARGFGVSFSGAVTFKSAQEIQAAARVVPPELLLVETDCPYMAPVPLRGKRCEPAFVAHTARFLAGLRGEEEPALRRRTAENAVRLLELPAALVMGDQRSR
jgi:TatD DNase family protein